MEYTVETAIGALFVISTAVDAPVAARRARRRRARAPRRRRHRVRGTLTGHRRALARGRPAAREPRRRVELVDERAARARAARHRRPASAAADAIDPPPTFAAKEHDVRRARPLRHHRARAAQGNLPDRRRREPGAGRPRPRLGPDVRHDGRRRARVLADGPIPLLEAEGLGVVPADAGADDRAGGAGACGSRRCGHRAQAPQPAAGPGRPHVGLPGRRPRGRTASAGTRRCRATTPATARARSCGSSRSRSSRPRRAVRSGRGHGIAQNTVPSTIQPASRIARDSLRLVV